MIIGFVDYCLYLSIGKRSESSQGRRHQYGFTVGPWFLSLDKDGDSCRSLGKPNNRWMCEGFHWEFFQKQPEV